MHESIFKITFLHVAFVGLVVEKKYFNEGCSKLYKWSRRWVNEVIPQNFERVVEQWLRLEATDSQILEATYNYVREIPTMEAVYLSRTLMKDMEKTIKISYYRLRESISWSLWDNVFVEFCFSINVLRHFSETERFQQVSKQKVKFYCLLVL